LPRRLLLQRPEGSKVTLPLGDLLHTVGAKSTDQLVLEVLDADVEAQRLHVGASEMGPEPGPLETAPEVILLSRVTETRQPEVMPLRTQQRQEASYRLCTADWDDGDALGVEIAATALRESFECHAVANPLDEHDRTRVDARRGRVCCSKASSTATGGGFGLCQVTSLLLVHTRIFTAETGS
jgi:hypothetical protein